jgi:hypothetical protein
MLAYAINRNLTARVLGHVRLFIKPADWVQIAEWIKTASPEANAAMARWDPQGKGYTDETVVFDLAHLTARAVAELRAKPGRAKGPVEAHFPVMIGDWEVQFTVCQADKRADLHLTMGEAIPNTWVDELPDFAPAMIRAGMPVFIFMREGLVNLSEVAKQSYSQSGDI